MAIHYDPQDNEIKALRRYARWQGSRVLELGSGEGRLSERLAALGAIMDAYDPDESRIEKARAKLSRQFQDMVTYHVGGAEKVAAPDQHYDLVIYSWSL